MSSRMQASNVMGSRSSIHVVALAAAILLLLSACGGSEQAATQASSAPQAATAAPQAATMTPAVEEEATTEAEQPPTAEPAQAPTTGVTVAVNANFKPFVFIDENGNLAGFDIDLMNALSAAGNFEVGFEDRPFDGMIDALAAGEYDAAISAITITDARREMVDFTAPYFQPGQAPVSFFSSGQGIGVRSDNTDIVGKDDLTSGVIVGVKTGTTGDEFAGELEGVTLVRFEESPQVLDALVDGAVDAAVVDIAVITDYIKQSQGAVKLVGGPVTEEEYGIAVSKQRQDVLEMLNAALDTVRANGAYDAIFAKWFGSP